MTSKQQILFIHGGTTHSTRENYITHIKSRELLTERRNVWSDDYLTLMLGDSFQIIRPRMPLAENAQYEDWKIHFERFFDVLEDNVILIGCSLGGIFLARYLSEHTLPVSVLSVYLICPPFDNTLPDEELVNGFLLPQDISLLENCCSKVRLMFSENDPVVPIDHAEKYRDKLQRCEIITYPDKNGHFYVHEFPEIISMIREDVS